MMDFSSPVNEDFLSKYRLLIEYYSDYYQREGKRSLSNEEFHILRMMALAFADCKFSEYLQFAGFMRP